MRVLVRETVPVCVDNMLVCGFSRHICGQRGKLAAAGDAPDPRHLVWRLGDHVVVPAAWDPGDSAEATQHAGVGQTAPEEKGQGEGRELSSHIFLCQDTVSHNSDSLATKDS